MSNFKKTIRTILLFVLMIAVISTAIMEVFFYGENYYYQDARERDELSGTIDFIVCGSSHTMRSLKPTILDEKLDVTSYNLSASNITMQGRYEMLKREIERNQVKTVGLGLSYNSLTRTRDVKGYEGDYYVLAKLDILHRIPYFFSSIRPSEYISIYYEYLSKGFDCIDKAVHGTWTDKNDKSDLGYVTYDFLLNEEEEKVELTDDYASIYNTRKMPETLYEPSVEYLDKILDLCAENDIQVILYTTPISKTLISRYPNLDVFRGWYEEIAEEHGVQFYDFNLYKEKDEIFSDLEDFHDVHHLNDQGADKFSEIFADIYTRAEKGEDVSDLFYDNYEELEKHIFDFVS